MRLTKCHILLKILVLFLTRAKSQEVSTRSSLLPPRNFNHHPYDAIQFLKRLKAIEPTKQGPVLFPNDAPPPPRPPLIVTSRPLAESIARSELNNTVTSQSQVHGFLARIKDYRPFIPTPTFDYNVHPARIPYSNVINKNIYQTRERDHTYNDYEQQTVLPPIYKALGDHAKQSELKTKEKNKFNYQINQPDYSNYQNNEINDNASADYDDNKNYAFSYTVKDQKTGDDFSHSQQSSGSATNGEYRVRLPDGRMQIVSYTADENGYNADVRYDEEKSEVNNIENDYASKTYANNAYKEEKTSRNDVENDYHNYAPKNFEEHVYPIVDYVSTQNFNYNNQHADDINRSTSNIKFTENIKPVDEKDDYVFQDNSREFYNDYSTEYNNNKQPYKSKFAAFTPTKAAISGTVTPDYELIKKILLNKNTYKTEQNYDNEDYNLPSTTPFPYDDTTEHIVVITKPPPLYTNIVNSLSVRSDNFNNADIGQVASYNANRSPRVVVATTPRSYLVSTIESLKNRVHLATKPILSDSYIKKINKYLDFN